MPRYQATFEFDHDPDCIYGILSEPEDMSDFMPLCKRSRVLHRERGPDGAQVLTANFLLRYRRIHYEQSFDLKFTYWHSERRMMVEEPNGTIGSGSSTIIVADNGAHGSRVHIDSQFRFKNLVLRWLLPRRLAMEGMNRIMERVRQRADELEQFGRAYRSVT
jgi:ribosome-associated toxin RatA of RatAB toxin-antitoxin module